MSEKPGSQHHVVPNPEGGGDVRRDGASRSGGHFDTKQGAVDAGRKISRNQGTEFVIHNRDGRIADRDSHGNDPYPPKGWARDCHALGTRRRPGLALPHAVMS